MARQRVEEIAFIAKIGDGHEVTAMYASGVARSLGVTRQRVYQLLHESKDFPRPAAVTPRGAIWLRSSVEKWSKARSR